MLVVLLVLGGCRGDNGSAGGDPPPPPVATPPPTREDLHNPIEHEARQPQPLDPSLQQEEPSPLLGDEEGIGGADRTRQWSVRPDARRPKGVPEGRWGGDAATNVTPTVTITSPADGLVLPNPITFEYTTSSGIFRVAFYVDGFPMQDQPFIPERRYAYRFAGVNVLRRVELVGLSEDGREIARDTIRILPSAGYIVEPPGFNRYVIRAINDWVLYPKDGRYPYCWRECPGTVGMIHDTSYLGEVRWTGDGHCVCTGHTLEIFLDAYRRWQAESGAPQDLPFGALTRDQLRREFYQFWQGYKVTESASCADALEVAGIGYNLYPEQWNDAQAGDFMNISRTNGTGHAVIFIKWVTDREDNIVGIRYYGCNRQGDSHPDPADPANRKVSGPSFKTEKFDGWGGSLIPSYVFLGRVLDPSVL